MYEKLLKEIELGIETGFRNFPKEAPLTEILDLIIKIKTIQAMDISKELIAESRRISRN